MEKKKILLTVILMVVSIWNSKEVFGMSANVQYIYDYVYSACGNELGASAMLGNLTAESGIISYRKQGDFTSGYTKSIEYTQKVDDGTISRDQFVHDSIGYGLAQWTFSSRKAEYYDWCQSRGGSIGDTDNGVSFLVDELQRKYPTVWSAVCTGTDLKTISDIVLHQFENPAKQDASVENYRYSLSVGIYNEYAKGLPPIPPTPPAPEPTPETDYSHYILCIIGDDE